MKKPTLFTIAIWLICVTVSAQIINVPADQASIQAGINAATDGDTVLVAPGTYYENINFMGKAITVASHFIMDDNIPQNESLVAHWLFNGNGNDASGNGHNGTASAGHPNWGGGMPKLAEDRHGNADYCYKFTDGANFAVPNDPAFIPPDLTISVWMKLQETWAHNYFISNDIWHSWKFQVQEANKPFFTAHILKDDGSGEETWIDKDSSFEWLEIDTWHHVVLTYTSGKMIFYIDGENVQEWDDFPTGTLIPPHAGIDLCIGQALATDDFDDDEHEWKEWLGYFKGYLDDMRFYNVILTDAEVKDLYDYEKDNTITDPDYVSTTIIDGGQAKRSDSASVVSFISGEDTTSVLCGFTITNGSGTLITNFPPNISRIAGGIFLYESGASILHNLITNNSLTLTNVENGVNCWGAGVGAYSEETSSWVIFENNRVINNILTSDTRWSGGSGCTFVCNSIVFNNDFINNRVINIGTGTDHRGYGAGLEVYSHDYPEFSSSIIGNVFSGNSIESPVHGWGAGASAENMVIVVRNNTFADNKVEVPEMSGSTWTGGAGLSYFLPVSGSIIENNFFYGNTVKTMNNNGKGGGMQIQGFSNNTVTYVSNNIFMNDTATSGGGMYTKDVRLHLQNNVFVKNYAQQNGGGAYIWGDYNYPGRKTAWVVNNSFSENEAANYGGAINFMEVNSLAFNNIFWNNIANTGNEIRQGAFGELEIAYSVIDTSKILGDFIDGGGNINEDPLFDNPDSLTIQPSSPCVDAGANVYVFDGDSIFCPPGDLINHIRPWDGNEDGDTITDIGAYESDSYIYVWIEQLAADNDEENLEAMSYPNPASDQVRISYYLPSSAMVSIEIFNASGKRIYLLTDEFKQEGRHSVGFDTRSLKQGLYFYRLKADKEVAVGKVVIAHQ